MRRLVELQDELEVAYARLAVVSVDPPEVQSAFRAGLGARFAFLSDHERRWLGPLGMLEEADTVHHPYLPVVFCLSPDLTIHSRYDGNWFLGRPTTDELLADLRDISRRIRPDWNPA